MQEEITFGAWLRKQRRALDLSRRAFADQVGCAQITLRRIEAGALKPSKELANILLENIGIPETARSQWISFARGLSGFPSQSSSSSNKPKSNLPALLTNLSCYRCLETSSMSFSPRSGDTASGRCERPKGVTPA